MIACGLRILAHLAGPGAFAGRGTCGPRHVMTDDSDAEGAAAREVWPCVQRLLCTFHIGQATWRWLRTPGNGVTEDKRQQRMQELLLICQYLGSQVYSVFFCFIFKYYVKLSIG